VSRRRVDEWICLAVHALLIRSPNWLPLFLVALYGLLGRRHGGACVFLLRAHGPYRYLRDGYRILICQQRLFCLSCPVSSSTLSYPRYFFRLSSAMAKKKITGAELVARARANGYQRGTHRDKDGLRDRNKHVDKVQLDQNAALDRYVL
jgi:hypothetical protein